MNRNKEREKIKDERCKTKGNRRTKEKTKEQGEERSRGGVVDTTPASGVDDDCEKNKKTK